MFKKIVESNEKWHLWLLGGSFIVFLEGVIFIILYYLGFLEWALRVGTMFLVFGGMSLLGVVLFLVRLYFVETKKNIKQIDERSVKIMDRAKNHGLYALLLVLLNIFAITTWGEVPLTAIFTVYCAFAGFFVTGLASVLIQELLY
ncbi:MAG: hypothetical protein ACFFC7_09955 [Candidatus Hermodarchaeota archaeon]